MCTKLVLTGPLHTLVLLHWTSYTSGGWFLLSHPLDLLSSPLLSVPSFIIAKVLLYSLISASMSFSALSQFVVFLLVCFPCQSVGSTGQRSFLFRTVRPKLSPIRTSQYLFNERLDSSTIPRNRRHLKLLPHKMPFWDSPGQAGLRLQ